MEDSGFQFWINLHYPMDEQCYKTSLINPPVELAWLKIHFILNKQVQRMGARYNEKLMRHHTECSVFAEHNTNLISCYSATNNVNV